MFAFHKATYGLVQVEEIWTYYHRKPVDTGHV
jgi:hypothetical protein